VEGSNDNSSTGRAAGPEGIAIVGMSCLFPGAPDVTTFWQNIVSKVDAISDPPEGSWDPARYYDPASRSNDRVYCKRGGYIGDIARFRPTEFGVMPANVEGGEPDQWLALQLAYAALADAGYEGPPPEGHQTEVILGKGTYINRGNMTVGYHGMIVDQMLQVLRNLHPEYDDAEIRAIRDELKSSLPPFSADTAPALIGNIIAGRVANRLDLMGPSFTVDGACASALLAVEIGVRDLLTRKCDLVIAGGANVSLPLPTLILFCQLSALSKREEIRPFDESADGTLLGEGLGMVVLKRVEDAVRSGDRIYAVIRGVGTASDGRGQHVMAPRVEGEELALRRAYRMAGIDPQSVGLIEAHGTATNVGDVAEVEALKRVFGERRGLLPSCAVGSVKSMIGHTMPAAGIAGLIKAALALHHRILPPTIKCSVPNPRFGLEQSPFYINTETRPWIHGRDAPRRAGVNAFGFGGINGHVVLEEHGEAAELGSSHLLSWETEACIIGAASRAELIEKGRRLRSFLETNAGVSLKDLAYTLNSELAGARFRLGIVASSVADLTQRLDHALQRLANESCRQIKDSKGIYFFEESIAQTGKLAVMFPGEGAQYPNMLADLCLHFPEVRACFDLADRAFADHPRGYLPSDFIFPRTIVSDHEREEMAERLWQIDGAVEAVLISNRAMWTLLEHLQLEPDVFVGHSTGDYSAMSASGVIQLPHDDSHIQTIRAWDKAHERLSEKLSVPEASLVAVAADSATIRAIAEDVDGDIFIAMDNCPHQNVIVGDRETIAQAVDAFRGRGLIFEVLPFDRPYHTPLFRAYAEGAGEELFARLPIARARTDVYSCTTAALYPDRPDEIARLYVDHWVEPVRFTDTVEQMYADGVRVFVEAGPKGNLSAFVSDILRGRPHIVVPSNVAARSGITQLNHFVGMLAALGVELDLSYLYARREPRRVAWQDRESLPASRAPSLKLAIGMVDLIVKPRSRSGAESARRAAAIPPLPASRAAEEPGAAPSAILDGAPSRRPDDRSGGTDRDAVMQRHLEGMADFLSTQQAVMTAYLRHLGRAHGRGASRSAQSADGFPLLGSIVSVTPGERLSAERRLAVEDDVFLKDHALGGVVSRSDRQLTSIIVMPLTMSMEILAEAAAALLPGRVVVAMREIDASRWIRVDDGPVTLRIFAERLAQEPSQVAVRIVIPTPAGSGSSDAERPVLRGIVVLAERYPAPPPASPLRLRDERSSRLASTNLYDGRSMFHGPCFQGVSQVTRSGSNGAIGELRVLPNDRLFRGAPNPRFVIDPVVLDAAGQLVGFWAKEYLPRGFVVFPYRLKELRVYGPTRPIGERCECRLALELLGQDRTRSDLDILAPDGTVWMQLNGWEDRRFDPPPAFHEFWIAPDQCRLGAPWPTVTDALAGESGVECHRLDRLFERPDPFWTELWSSLVLSRDERKRFVEETLSTSQRQEWLHERSVAKEAVRALLKRNYQLDLLPADVEISEDDRGRLLVGGPWVSQVSEAPRVSVAHARGTAVAVAGLVGTGGCLGVDLETLREVPEDFETTAFSAQERELYRRLPSTARSQWILRLWCAKEAIRSALGRKLSSDPASVEVTSIDPGAGIVGVAIRGQLAAELPELVGAQLAAYTFSDGERVAGLTFCERKTV
jgi:acyl transferase domain-containing protein/phosphopantetheinyl transferase